MTFQKGKSGNPKGRSTKSNPAILECQQYRGQAIAVYVQNLADEDPAIRKAAADALLNRGYGLPKETVEMEVDNNHSGEVGISGLPNLMGAITSDIQRRRAKSDLQISGADEPVLSAEVSSKPE